MKALLYRYWHVIALSVLLLTIFLVNYQPGAVIFGLDNASPYWDPLAIWTSKTSADTVFLYAGLYFLTPILAIFKVIGFNPSLLSHLYVWSMAILGITGTATLVQHIALQSALVKPNGNYAKAVWLLGAVTLLSSLFSVWILNQPNILFLAAYGTIPWLVHFLSRPKLSPKQWLIVLSLSWLLLISGQNLVALALYLVQVVVLVLVIGRIRRTPKRLFSLAFRTIMWAVGITLFLGLILQAALWLRGDNTLLPQAFSHYVTKLNDNADIKTISSDIRLSEQYNTVLNSVRFATGWMELHYPSGQPVFHLYDTYRNNGVFIVLGLIPTALIAWFSWRLWGSKEARSLRRVVPLLVVMILGLILISRLTITITDPIPYVRDALRWTSSKFWPLFIIPWVALASISLASWLEKSSRSWGKIFSLLTFSLYLVALITYVVPVWNGKLFSTAAYSHVPDDYTQFLVDLPSDSRVLLLPPPQQLYFRQHNWGYYGSDWLTYVTKGHVIDKANLYQYGADYTKLLDSYQRCQIEDLANIEYLLFDHSVQPDSADFTTDLLACWENTYRIKSKTPLLTLYERI